MRLAIIAPLVAPIREPQRGGSQAFICDLARGLIDRGAEVALYAAAGSELPGVPVVDVGVDSGTLSASLFRASGGGGGDSAAVESAFAAVYSAVREEESYDVIHNHAFDAPAISLASGLEAPVVHTVHLPPSAAVSAALRRAASQASPPTVATVSAFQAAGWREVVPVDAILPPYVPTARIPWSRAEVTGALFAGRLSPEKGAAEAIDIAQAAGVAIDLYGDSYDADYARDRIDPRRDEAGVSIHAAVPRSTLWEAMGRAAVVLCPAGWDEPFGMVAAEAQACGTPVVAFDRGAIGEVIVDGVTGFLVRPGEIGSAADAVSTASGLSRAECRAHATGHLDLERSLDAHERLYRHLVGATTGAAVRG
jgi:glycosyltransferase involved in cell wall biosynthesis